MSQLVDQLKALSPHRADHLVVITPETANMLADEAAALEGELARYRAAVSLHAPTYRDALGHVLDSRTALIRTAPIRRGTPVHTVECRACERVTLVMPGLPIRHCDTWELAHPGGLRD